MVSHEAARVAAQLGWTNVWVMTDGIKGWEKAGLPTETGTAEQQRDASPAPVLKPARPG
jgi:3-mercaptopyruvate sulfurtransferase SseA